MLLVATTGHRPDKLGGYDSRNPIRRACRLVFRDVLRQLRDEVDHDLLLLDGLALGWDQDAAAVARSEGVPFRGYVPFVGQELMWPPTSQQLYRRILVLLPSWSCA